MHMFELQDVLFLIRSLKTSNNGFDISIMFVLRVYIVVPGHLTANSAIEILAML